MDQQPVEQLEQPTPQPSDQPVEQLPNDEFTQEELAQLRDEEVAFRWQASEFVHHEKDARWYLILAAVVVILSMIMVFLQYWTSLILVIVMAVAVVVYARKPPKLLTYELTNTGLTVEGRSYPYSSFRSFGVLPDESWHTIDLEPTQKFSLRISVLFDEQDYDDIVGHLQLHLPRVDRKPGLVENLTRYLRF